MKIQMIIAGIIRVRGCLCWAKFPRDVKANTSYHLYQGEAGDDDDDDELGVLFLSPFLSFLSPPFIHTEWRYWWSARIL